MKLQKNEDGTFELDALEVVVKKSLWDKISGFFWGTLKVFLVILVIGGIYGAGELDETLESSVLEKTYLDAYFREVSKNDEALQIGMVELSGVITSQTDMGFDPNFTNAENFIATLVSVVEDENIDAVLIRVNSPGGEVLATEQITTVIDILREKSEKKIYVLLEGMAASGGYYVATSGEKIFAYPETLLGNIGVRIDMPNVEALMGKIGVKMNTVSSGDMKTIGSPFRDMTEDEQKIFQDLVDESYEKFVGRVATGRNISLEEAKILADGRIYSGTQAQENGLIDTLVSSFPLLATEISLDMNQSEKEVQFVSVQPKISDFKKMLMGVSGKFSGLSATTETQFLMQ